MSRGDGRKRPNYYAEIKYQRGKLQHYKYKIRELDEILIPIYDEFGDLIRYKIEHQQITREYSDYRFVPSYELGPGLHAKYDLLNTFVKCRCGRYTSHISMKCHDCGDFSANTHGIPMEDLHGDRSLNLSMEALFDIGRIGCDVMIEKHEVESYYSYDGRDMEHEDWWGG